MSEHKPTYVEEAGLIDEYVCSCGWKSGPFYDGAEFAYAKWKKHAANPEQIKRVINLRVIAQPAHPEQTPAPSDIVTQK